MTQALWWSFPEESEGVSGKQGRLSDLEAPRSGPSLPVIRSDTLLFLTASHEKCFIVVGEALNGLQRDRRCSEASRIRHLRRHRLIGLILAEAETLLTLDLAVGLSAFPEVISRSRQRLRDALAGSSSSLQSLELAYQRGPLRLLTAVTSNACLYL